MSEKLLIGYLSFAGVIVTVLVSYFTSLISARYTIKKLQGELSGKLYEKKLSVYPLIFQTISEFLKKIKESDITQQNILELKEKFDKQDSEYAIFYNAITVEATWELRVFINGALILKSYDFEDWKAKSIQNLSERLKKVELALKYELGVYGFSTPTEFKKSKAYLTYQQAWPLKKRLKKINQVVLSKIKKTKGSQLKY